MNKSSYIRAVSPVSKRKVNIFSLLILLLWLVLVIFVALYHELWRDEAHSFYVALSAKSLWQLPDVIKNEGHPILWFGILWLGYHLTGTQQILQISSIAIGFISVLVFFRFSPFSFWFKILFLFSFLPLYEYTIMARNYGISMLFFFLFAALFHQKKEKPYLLAFILVALAQTNIHSTIFVCFLSLYWAYEGVIHSNNCCINISTIRQIWMPLCMVLFSVFIAVITVIPDNNSIVMQTSSISLTRIFDSLLQKIIHPGSAFHEIFVGLPNVVRDLLIWLFAAGLLIRPFAALLVLSGAIALGVFFSIGYNGVLRHQGIFFIFVLSLYWITLFETEKDRERLVPLTGYLFKLVLYGVIPLVLAIHIVGSYKYIVRDVTKEMSSNKAFGELLTENEQYRDAIVMGEPDIRLESLPYYVDNPIFVPRINRYEKFVKLTKENKKKISLGEILSQAKLLKEKEHKTILIALGHFDLIGQKPPFVRTEQYARKFTWSLEELNDFHENTSKIAEFKESVRNERYEVYRLK